MSRTTDESTAFFGPGANQYCETQPTRRIRKEWRRLTSAERELFVSTLEKALASRRLQRFLDYHTDQRSSFQAHATCGFALWHRRFLLAAEDMLRDIDPPRTSCLTVPYWDISLDYARQERGECFSFASCAPGLFHDMMGGVPGLFWDENGGRVDPDTSNRTTSRRFGIYTASGVLVPGRPVSNFTDDEGRPGLVRHDLFQIPLPPSADRHELKKQILENPTYDAFTHKMQEAIHDDVHFAIGGFMPSFSSPADVFFWVWHSTIDLIFNLWQGCQYAEPWSLTEEFMGHDHCAVRPLWSDSDFLLGGPPPLEYPSGMDLQPSSNEHMTMQKQINATTTMDVRDDPVLGKYFQNVGNKFEEVADVRSMPTESSFSFELVDDENAMWTTMTTLCPATNGMSVETDKVMFSMDRAPQSVHVDESQGKGMSYPYADLERLISQWVTNIFPSNDPLREDDSVHRQRLQFMSCAILHTRGSIVLGSDGNETIWEILLSGARSRTDEAPPGAPDRCSFLWPGAWIAPAAATGSPGSADLETTTFPSTWAPSNERATPGTPSNASCGGRLHQRDATVTNGVVLSLLLLLRIFF